MVNQIVIHVHALERFRRRNGKSVTQVLGEVGMTAADLNAGVRGGGFTLADLARLAEALDTTPRDLATASTVLTAAENLRQAP
ncbi:hypothetical protein LTA6_001589 [Microbacterium sp. LTA6]|uniref:hypothetical protein n=1 Tax=unclassified Microbacterium TaxID=2609290 RepID=UPI003139DF91